MQKLRNKPFNFARCAGRRMKEPLEPFNYESRNQDEVTRLNSLPIQVFNTAKFQYNYDNLDVSGNWTLYQYQGMIMIQRNNKSKILNLYCANHCLLFFSFLKLSHFYLCVHIWLTVEPPSSARAVWNCQWFEKRRASLCCFLVARIWWKCQRSSLCWKQRTEGETKMMYYENENT